MKFSAVLALCLLLPVAASAQLLQLDRTDAKRDHLGNLQFRGAYIIPPSGKVGGLSALAVLDADHLLALSDTAKLFRLSLQWDDKGNLRKVVPDAGSLLLDENGLPPKTRARFDSESLARNDKGWLIGFEREHRIEQYAEAEGRPTGRPTPLPVAADWAALPRNQGLEALTVLPGGRVFALAEAAQADGSHPGWLWQDGHWSHLNYQSAPGLMPSDMAVLPDGDVLVLERGFNFLYGFRARLVRLSADAIRAGASVNGIAWATLETPVLNENFEGLAVAVKPGGGVRIFLVSDNNYNAAQQTILAVFDTIAVN